MKRPACGQCVQRGSICPGYGGGMTFVLDSRSVKSDGQPFHMSRAHDRSLLGTPSSCVRSAAQIGLMDHFWYLYLPRKQASPRSTHGSLNEFYEAVNEFSDGKSISMHALWALSSLTVGREVGNSQLLREGARMYGTSLQETQLALKSPQTMITGKLTLTCNMLALYEVSGLYFIISGPSSDFHRYSTILPRHALASLLTARVSLALYGFANLTAFLRMPRGRPSKVSVQLS